MKVTRQLSAVPKPLMLVLGIMLTAQFVFTWIKSSEAKAVYQALTPPLAIAKYQFLSLNSMSLAAHILTLKLQLHDNQKGRHLSYSNVSYAHLSQWLIHLQAMNPRSEYSALLASRVFSNTNDKNQLRLMLKTVIKLFDVNPQKNWRWMAEGAVIAKYHLKDLNLALTMAKSIAQQPKQMAIPAWARDLEFIILEELNMIDAAIYIVEKSLSDQSNMHRDEKYFLTQRLSALKQKSVENSTKQGN